MINLYEKLGISPNASVAEIQNAMKKAAQTQVLSVEQLQKAKEWLLNEEVRKKYNAKLFAEHPEILQQMMSNHQPKTQSNSERPKPRRAKKHLQLSAYVESSLTDGEEAVYIAQVSWWSQIGLILGGVVFAVLALQLNWIFLLFTVICVSWAVVNVICTELALTDQRIISKFGFIRREAVELNLHRVESIVIQQSILGRLLNFGSIVVRGTGGGNAPIKFIHTPMEFKRAVNEELKIIRNQN